MSRLKLRLCRSVVLVIALVFAGLPLAGITRAEPTFDVDSTLDEPDEVVGDGICSSTPSHKCTLRAAVEEGQASNRAVVVPAGLYELTRGHLDVTQTLTLTGAGSGKTKLDGKLTSRVFDIRDTGSASISDVTIQRGRGTPGFAGHSHGGGIHNHGTLILVDSTVRASLTDVVSGVFWGGGGITNAAPGGRATLVNVTIASNAASGSGGGIENNSTLDAYNVTIVNNQSFASDPRGGGGITNVGTATLENVTIASNAASGSGGGIENLGSLDITNSTISGNQASVGGGIRNSPSGVVNVSFSTITDNEAGLITGEPQQNRVGGGIANFGQVNIGNTILAGNSDGHTPSDARFAPDCFSVEAFRFTSFRGNLVGVVNQNCDMRDTIFGDTRFDLVCIPGNPLNLNPPQCTPDNLLDPRLGPLANNGGQTQTHALLRDSPAIDQGTGVTSATFFDCPATDQRGFTRPVDGDGDGTADCDIGAFEFGAVPPEISFQDGVSPTPAYAGTRDTSISEDQPTTNFCRVPTLRVDGDDPPGTGRDLRTLLQWDLSAIPAGGEVTSATITINVTNPTNGTYELFRISSPWDECVTWNTRPSRGTTVRGTVGPASTGTHTITLNNDGVALVQSWVDGSTPNHGIMMVGSAVPDGLAFDSREASPASNRPRLTITFDSTLAIREPIRYRLGKGGQALPGN